MKELEIKAAKIIDEFIEHELSDYSGLKYRLEETRFYDSDSVIVEYDFGKESTPMSWSKTLRFKVTFDDLEIDEPEETDVTIEIDQYEDQWEEVRTFDSHVRYFWIALLNWDI